MLTKYVHKCNEYLCNYKIPQHISALLLPTHEKQICYKRVFKKMKVYSEIVSLINSFISVTANTMKKPERQKKVEGFKSSTISDSDDDGREANVNLNTEVHASFLKATEATKSVKLPNVPRPQNFVYHRKTIEIITLTATSVVSLETLRERLRNKSS